MHGNKSKLKRLRLALLRCKSKFEIFELGLIAVYQCKRNFLIIIQFENYLSEALVLVNALSTLSTVYVWRSRRRLKVSRTTSPGFWFLGMKLKIVIYDSVAILTKNIHWGDDNSRKQKKRACDYCWLIWTVTKICLWLLPSHSVFPFSKIFVQISYEYGWGFCWMASLWARALWTVAPSVLTRRRSSFTAAIFETLLATLTYSSCSSSVKESQLFSSIKETVDSW